MRVPAVLTADAGTRRTTGHLVFADRTVCDVTHVMYCAIHGNALNSMDKGNVSVLLVVILYCSALYIDTVLIVHITIILMLLY